MANWRDILATVRRYTGDAFTPARGYSARSKMNFGRRMALLKYLRKIEELTIYGSETYTPKRGEKAEVFRTTGQTGYTKFTKAIVKKPEPNAKLKITVDKSRPKGSQLIVTDQRPNRQSTYYNIPANVILDAVDEAEENGDLPSEYIEDVLQEYAPDARFFMIRTDNYYAWGMSLGDSGNKGKIGERIYKMMMDYDQSKFNPTDKNSSFFGNWFNGVTAFTRHEDAFPVITQGIKRRAEYLAKHRRHLDPGSARDRYRETADGRFAHYKAGRFQGVIDVEYYDSHNEACIAGWNAYIDGLTRDDNPYDMVKERLNYVRWLRCFNNAEEAAAMGQKLERR